MKSLYETPLRVKEVNTTWRDGLELVLIRDQQHLHDALQEVEQQTFAADIETTGLDFEKLDLIGFSFCATAKKAFYAPVAHRFGNNLALQPALDRFFEAMYKTEKPKLFYNKLYDLRGMRKYGLRISPLDILQSHIKQGLPGLPTLNPVKAFDVMALVWNTDVNLPMPSLKDSIKRFCGIEAPTYEMVVGDAVNLQNLEPEQVVEYAACDPLFTLMLAQTLFPFYKNNRFIVDLDNDFLMPLLGLMDQPLYIDREMAVQDAAEITVRLRELERQVYALIGKQFDLASPQQLDRTLEELGIDTGKRTEKTQSMVTGIDELKLVRHLNPAIDCIIEHKELSKQLSSYVEPFINDYRDDLHGFRIQYQAFKVPTARLSSGIGKREKPGYYAKINIQSVISATPMMYRAEYDPEYPDHILGWRFIPDPAGKFESGDPKWNSRNYVSAPPGYWLLDPDYSGQELVIAGNESEDPAFLEPLGRGDDIHKDAALRMWPDVPYSKALRKLAKAANFGLQYLGTPYTLHRTIQQEDPTVTMEKCEEIYEKWWNIHGASVSWKEDKWGRRWPNLVPKTGLAAWHRRLQQEARQQGYFKTRMGRICRTTYWYSSPDRKDQSFGDRTVSNRPVQGGCGDVLRYVYCQIFKRVMMKPEWGGSKRVLLYPTLHDEMQFCVTQEEPFFTEITLELSKCMVDLDFLKYKVPLTIEMSLGRRWGSVFKFEFDKQGGSYGHWKPKGL